MRELRGGEADGFIINAHLPAHQTVITSPKGTRYYLRGNGHFYVEGCLWDDIPPIVRGD